MKIENKSHLANGELTAPMSVQALFTSAGNTNLEPRLHMVVCVGAGQGRCYACGNDVVLPINVLGIEIEPSNYNASVQEQRDSVAGSLRELADKIQSGRADATFGYGSKSII